MREDITATYHWDHNKIAQATGLELERVRKLAVSLGDILNPYRVSGDKGVYLYNHDGFLVWEQIAQLERQGKTPKTIRKHLLETLEIRAGKQETLENDNDPLARWMKGGRQPGKKVGDEVVPRFVYENTRADLKDEIKDQRDQLKNKDVLIKNLQDQLRFLPAPDEWKKKIADESRARGETIKLLKELKELEEKTYGWFSGGEKASDKKRIMEIVRELDELNLKH